jgi:tetratricopeptide (TPR) repeat protein
MKKAKLLFLLCVLLPLARPGGAASPAQESKAGLFAQGNSEYQKGNYRLAEQYYSRILNSGVDSGPLYYNLGNACFKQKQLGEAIYYWEKARQKMPADRELQQNLELANLFLVDRIEIPSDPLLLRILTNAQESLSVRQESWLALILFVAANALFSIYLLAKNPRLAFRALIGCLGMGILFLIFAVSLCWKAYENEYIKNGVVVEQKVDVRSGPGAGNITVFTIHEGIKVRVHGSSNGWYQISLPNGWSGWLNEEYIRLL